MLSLPNRVPSLSGVTTMTATTRRMRASARQPDCATSRYSVELVRMELEGIRSGVP